MIALTFAITGDKFLDRFLMEMGNLEEKVVREFIHDEQRLQEFQDMLREMVSRNFARRRNESGSGWQPLSYTTISLRSKGISRFGRKGGVGKRTATIVGTPLMASGEYFLSWMGGAVGSLYNITRRPMGATVSIGSNRPQNFNEEGGIIKSRIFRGKRVHPRRVAFYTNEDIIEVTETFAEQFEEWLGTIK